MRAEKTARVASESARLTPIIDTLQLLFAKGPVLWRPLQPQFREALATWFDVNQGFEHRWKSGISDGAHFIFRPVLNRMLNIEPKWMKTEGIALRFSGLFKFYRCNKGAW